MPASTRHRMAAAWCVTRTFKLTQNIRVVTLVFESLPALATTANSPGPSSQGQPTAMGPLLPGQPGWTGWWPIPVTTQGNPCMPLNQSLISDASDAQHQHGWDQPWSMAVLYWLFQLYLHQVTWSPSPQFSCFLPVMKFFHHDDALNNVWM